MTSGCNTREWGENQFCSDIILQWSCIISVSVGVTLRMFSSNNSLISIVLSLLSITPTSVQQPANQESRNKLKLDFV